MHNTQFPVGVNGQECTEFTLKFLRTIIPYQLICVIIPHAKSPPCSRTASFSSIRCNTMHAIDFFPRISVG